LRGGNEFVDIQFLACFQNRLDRFRPALSQTGISKKLSFGFRSFDTSLRAFCDKRSLELGDSTENLEREHALRRRGIDWISGRSKINSPLLEILEDLQQMAHGSGQELQTVRNRWAPQGPG
jgi:hypothetical protein